MNNSENACRRGLAILILIGLSGVSAAAQIEAPFTYATRYNVAGQVTGTIAPDPDGGGALRLLATRNTYNSLGLLEKVETGQLTTWADETIPSASWGSYGFAGANIFSTTEYSYDSYGRKLKELVRGVDGTPEALVQYSYDSESFVRCKAVRMNKDLFLTPSSDPCAPGDVGNQGPDRIFRYTNDIFGQVTQEERAVGTSLEQVYSVTTYAMYSPTSYTDANGNRTELKYTDGYGRLTELWYPSASTVGVANSSDKNKYEYDQNGNLWRETKRNGTATITNTFDALNRVTYKDLSDNSKGEDIAYDYDTRGLMLFARFSPSSAIGVFNEFDGFGRLNIATNVAVVGTTTASRALQYLYDANGNRTQVKHPDNTTFNYTFDGLNRVSCVSEGGNCDSNDIGKLVTVEYRADGRRNRLLRPGGASTNYGFDNAGRLLTFSQDLLGSADDLTNTFYYNPAGQAFQLTFGNSAFAPAGNSNRTGSYNVNGLNQYTANAGASILYDTNGNLTSDAPTAFTYDMENRLATMTNPAGALKYDPLGRLSEYTAPPAATIQFLYAGDTLVAEYTVSGNSTTLTRRYVHGAKADEPWVQYNGAAVGSASRRYLHADHQGSIIAQSNSSGTILGNKLTYDAFGIPGSTNYDRFGYTGQTWLKELGLNYYKARMYHPKLGRFLQTDPVGYKADYNLYAYVRNDPLNNTDSAGTCPEGAGQMLQGVVGTCDFAKLQAMAEKQQSQAKEEQAAKAARAEGLSNAATGADAANTVKDAVVAATASLSEIAIDEHVIKDLTKIAKGLERGNLIVGGAEVVLNVAAGKPKKAGGVMINMGLSAAVGWIAGVLTVNPIVGLAAAGATGVLTSWGEVGETIVDHAATAPGIPNACHVCMLGE